MGRRAFAQFMLLCFLGILLPNPSAAAVSHARSEEVGPVRLTYDQLYEMISTARVHVVDANAAFNAEQDYSHARESLTLEGLSSSIELSENFTEADLAAAPSESGSVQYQYDNSYDAPISLVRVRLGDYSREVQVKGTSEERVASLAVVLRDSLDRHQSLFGGVLHRAIGAGLLFAVGLMLPLGANLRIPRLSQMVFLVLGPAVSLSVFLLPWGSWFPGTFVYAGDPNFLMENAPLISLLGVILTLVTFAVSVTVSIKLSRPANQSTPASGDDGEAGRSSST